MAMLTADDVLNKTFQSVKFREGYDQIEVDEFLDEVVATIYALTVENSELKEKLAAADKRVQELQAGAPVESDEVVEEVVVVEESVEDDADDDVVVEELNEPEAATAMLSMAQRVHDEYVTQGREEGEIILREAKEKRESVLNNLENEKKGLEETIENLRSFEADYRSSIADHLNKLLTELETDPADAD